MHRIQDARQKVYDHFEQNTKCQKNFHAAGNADKYAAYYTSMYLLQDTAESLQAHREKDFSTDPLTAYIELWGVMQALIIQQDSLVELYKIVAEKSPCKSKQNLNAWNRLRDFRNACAGHPVNKRRKCRGKATRTFMGRCGQMYSKIAYEEWDQIKGERQHREIDLGALIDEYETEAESIMSAILQAMLHRWP